MIRPIHLIFLCQLLVFSSYAQNAGIIKGVVRDNLTNEALIGATIILANQDKMKGTVTDQQGQFILNEIPFGIHSLSITYVGYENLVQSDIAVYDKKGAFISVNLSPSAINMDEVIVTPFEDPASSTDPLAVISARSISPSETNRFAGSLGDPSRMALSFAGVNSGRGDNNDIIVRGNAAKYLQWKLEGLEIPNPNHFGVYGSSGGLLNILNSKNLGRSDFYIGAFPAHTGNALAGVFDLSLRNGNPNHHKHSLETSLIGLSASSEGPLKITNGGSYIANYRYSALGLMKKLGIVYQAPDYQDLTFKVNLPTENTGQFMVYGIAGLGTWLEEDFFRKIDSSRFSQGTGGGLIYGYDEIAAENLNRYNLGIFGVKHRMVVGKKHVLINHFNFSSLYSAPRSSDINRDDFSIYLESEGQFSNSTFRYQPEWTTQFNPSSSLHAGATLAFVRFHSKLINGFANQPTRLILESQDNSFLGQAFVSYVNTSLKKVKFVTGLHHTYFSLNKQQILEPRIAMHYQISDHNALSFASGFHSTTESPEVYLTINDKQEVRRRKLDMSRSWQTVLAYKRKLGDRLLFTAEAYVQYLFDIPIAADSSNFSFINESLSFTDISLINQGKGLNYGLDLTLEKFFSKTYYILATASLFQSEYKLMEPFYRKSKYSNAYVVNILAGKEFRLKKDRFFGVDVRTNFSGGKPYIPTLLEESIIANQPVKDVSRAYFKQLPAYVGIDFSMNFKWIRNKLSHEIKLDIFRMFEQNYDDEVFVPEKLNRDGTVNPPTLKLVQYGEGQTASTLLPVLYYKITF